ncbi:MAG: S9 family peptidase [Phycisphaeraceae bacterium]|nr:MAG: S9 family peptidase [Phycisphaeraceae bacterium]
MNVLILLFAALCLVALCLGACAAGRSAEPTAGQRPAPPESVADPGFIEQWAATYRFSLGRPAGVNITPDGGAVLFLRSGPRSPVRDLYEFDPATGRERVLLTAADLLGDEEEELTAEELARRERMRLTARGIANYRLSDDGERILVNLSGDLFVHDRLSGRTHELHSDAGFPIDARFSPCARYVSCVRDGEVYVIEIESGTETRVTSGAGGTVTNGLSEFVAQEEMRRYEGYWWSPDSTRIVYQRTDTAGLETMHIMDATRPEVPPQTWPYPRPGKKNAEVTLGIAPIYGGETTWIDWDRETYEYLATVRWSENAPLCILVQNRRQTEQVLLAVDTDTGATTPLLTERDEAWINLDQQMPRWLADGESFLWTTERRGAWQLELRARDGSLIRELTRRDLIYRNLVALDEKTGAAVVQASPEGPTEAHLFRISLDPPGGPAARPERLTRRPGVHSAVFSEDMSLWVHSLNALDGERLQTVRRADGSVAGRLRSVAEEAPFLPRIEFTTVQRGPRTPEFHAAIIRPQNFDARRKYPVIVHVYGGPTSNYVVATADRYLLNQWFADHGFIVAIIDNRGTLHRGRAWHRTVKNDLIDIPLQDQVTALQLLGERYDEFDMSRVGMYGWSFGGYFSAMAVMRHPEVYRVGVAGAPVVDWADYDTHYTERYMDLPQDNPEGYEAANVLTYADRLERPLLLIHGTADDNVYFMHSLKLADALFREGKHFEFLPLTGFTHMVPDPNVSKRLYERIIEFLLEHLQR